MAGFTISDTPPPAPAVGDAWFDGVSGQTFVWVNDGSSTQWVVVVNQPDRIGNAGPANTVVGPAGPAGPVGPQGITGPSGGEYFFHTANDVTRLFDNLQLLIPGLTKDVAGLCIWAAIEDFYVRSTYRREHVAWTMAPGISTVNFDPWDDHWRVCRFMAFNGLSRVRFMPPGAIQDLASPVPDTTRNGDVLLALKPKDLYTILPYDVMTTYWETLLSGALYRVFLQPGKPYSDLNAAQVHAKMNRSGIASARADIQAGHVREGRAWTFPYFASGQNSAF